MKPRSAIRGWLRSWVGGLLPGAGIPVSAALARYRSVSTGDPDFLWIGLSLDEVVGEQLTQVGAAEEGNVPTGFHATPMSGGLMAFPNTTDAWSAVGTVIGDFDGSESLVLVIVFRVVGSMVGVQALVSKFAGAAGYEMTLNAEATLLCLVSDGTTDTFASFPRKYDGGEYFAFACRLNTSSGDVEILTTLDTILTFTLPPMSPSNTENWRIGRARVFAAPVEVGLTSLESGPQVDAIDLNRLVYGVARELFMEPVVDAEGNPVVDADGNEVLTHG